MSFVRKARRKLLGLTAQERTDYAKHWDYWWENSKPNMDEKNARVVFEHWRRLKRLAKHDAEEVWRLWNVAGVRYDRPPA